MKVRFTLTGSRQWYFTTNGVAWHEVTARQADHAIAEHGATLELA